MFLTCLCTLPLHPIWAQEVRFAADFEVPDYQPGSIHGQQGWKVDQGRADVLPGQGFAGTAGLVLRPVLPFSQARLSLEGDGHADAVSFVDLRVRPIASAVDEKAELLDINSARIGLFRQGQAADAAIWVFDGDGKGGGGWVETPLKIPVDASTGLTLSWHRLTVREDIRRQTWDLWLDGAWLAAGLGFQEERPADAATWILMGDRKELVALDNLSLSPANPLGADRDADGLTDAWESALGFDPDRDDRDEDADGDGLSNLDHAVNRTGAGEPQPLTAARRVVAAPEWSVPPGLLERPAVLAMLSATPGVSIRYTLDGSDPRRSGKGMSAPEGGLGLTRSTVIRAAAVTEDGRWSGVVSGAWIFRDQVGQQERPADWPAFFEDAAADRTPLHLPVPYQMKPDPGQDREAAEQKLRAALEAAPVVVVMADSDALFDQSDGLYSHSSASAGRLLENGTVQVSTAGGAATYPAGLSISGGSSRFHDVTLKHSLRLHFEQPRTGGDGLPGSGKQLLLRHPTQDSWAVAGRWGGMRTTARYFADGMADSWLASRGHVHLERRWVHVFLNQVYWGLYEAVEQPGPEGTGGSLLESGPEGRTEPIFGEETHWRALMTEAQVLAGKSRSGLVVDEAWEKLMARFEAGGLVDYIGLNLWLGNQDWPNRNYLISAPGGRFQFLSWDAEWVMPVGKTAVAGSLLAVGEVPDGPAALFTLLCESPAFRKLIRERLDRKSGFNDDAFAELAKAEAEKVRPLLPAEAARWGRAYNPGVDLMARWESNVQWVLSSWIPGRADQVREALDGFLGKIEASQTAGAARLARQKDAPPPSLEPVPFIAEVVNTPSDRDGDGLPDEWELAHGLNPDDPADAAADPDGDGLDNLAEYLQRRNPRQADALRPAMVSPVSGAFNRMEKPVIRRGKVLDQARAAELKKTAPGTAAAETAPPAQVEPAPASEN